MADSVISDREVALCEEWLFASGDLLIFETEHRCTFTMEQFRTWHQMAGRMVVATQALRAANLTKNDALRVCRMSLDMAKEVAM